MTFEISKTTNAELAALASLYRDAFPEEDLTGLVAELAPRDDVLSLAARENSRMVGHVCYTTCTIDGGGTAILLGPLAVASDRQHKGVGTALIGEGFARFRAVPMLVLGDPAYYSRFGFTEEPNITTPYAIPAEWAPAWQSVVPDGTAPSGSLHVPPPWQDSALWSS